MNDDDTATSSAPEGTSSDSPPTCATCGSPIDTEEWHPVATDWNSDGDLTVYTFCSQDCRDAWDRS